MRLRYDKLAQLFPKTLIPEVHRILGEEVTEKLLTVFSGTTIHIPSVREQENAMRDMAIFETLERAEDPSASKRLGEALSAQYSISRRKVRHIYRHMRRLSKLNTKLREEDLATSQHKKAGRTRRKKRRRSGKQK